MCERREEEEAGGNDDWGTSDVDNRFSHCAAAFFTSATELSAGAGFCSSLLLLLLLVSLSFSSAFDLPSVTVESGEGEEAGE